MLAVVIEKLFTLSIKVSQLEDKITVLSAEVAIRSSDSEKRIAELEEKEKKFLNISLKFYSDELDKPFGLYSAILEAFIGGYAKR